MPGEREKSQRVAPVPDPSEPKASCRSPLALLFWRCLRWAQRLDVADQLPALRLGQAGPYRHTLAHNAIGKQPEQGARRRLLHVRGAQAGTLLPAIGIRSVTLCAMLFEELGARCYSLIVRFERVAPGCGFGWYLRQFRVDRLGGTLRRGVRLCRGHGGQDGGAQEQRCSANDSVPNHCRPPNQLATVEPNPENSRETPQRNRSWWLWSFSPNPGDSRRVQLEGRFQATTGAR